MFAGFSAWFAPELRSYKQTWVKHGGEEKELTEADIAFITNKTSSGEASYKPTMKILRPDWIEDSVRGQKRLSLKRYKSVFPALTRFDSREHSKMAVGMDAYNSTNVISLDNSWQLHQPEPGMQDLSVTPSSGGASHKPSATQASITEMRTSSPFRRSLSVSATSTSKRRSFTPTPESAPRSITAMPGSAPRSITATPRSAPPSVTATPGSAPHSVTGTPGDGPHPFIATPGSIRTIALSKSESEKADDEDDDKSDEDEESNDIAEVDDREEESAVASPAISWRPSRSDSEPLKQGPMSENSMEGIEILVESASQVTRSDLVEATPQTPTTKKRRLPTSLLRPRREPARTHDSQVSEEFFASSDDEVDISDSSSPKRRASSQRSVDRADTVPLSPCDNFSSATFHSLEGSQPSSIQGHGESQQKARHMRAEDYLRDTLTQLDEGSKQLLLMKPLGVRLIDIDRDNIDLRKKRR